VLSIPQGTNNANGKKIIRKRKTKKPLPIKLECEKLIGLTAIAKFHHASPLLLALGM